MAQFTVRKLEDDVARRLKQRAALRGCSMEEEVRRILRDAVRDEVAPVPAGTRLAARFAGLALHEPLPELRGQTVVPIALKRR